MGDALERRGPDDAQYFDDGTLCLVYRRLSIIDVEGGRQPFLNESGDQLLVANGEIYNHDELRSALAGAHAFASRSDCEPLLHGFEEWDVNVLRRARGMFALAHWDLKTRVLTLARDRLGIKPLYLCRLGDGLLFGSELKALLAHPACPREIAWQDVDRTAIAQPYAATYVRGVELLPGGSFVRVDSRGTGRPEDYWRLEDHFDAAPYGDRASDYVDAYVALLQGTTVEHLQRDVGAGLHLSGGVDSSLLAAIVARHDREIPCFTVVERTSYLEGDVAAARRLTGRLGLPWMPVRFDYRSVVQDMRLDLRRIEEAIWMMDSPRFEIEWLFKEELHRAAREYVPRLKIVLLGQGADEFAGGYSRRVDAMYENWDDYLRREVDPNLVFDAATSGHGSLNYWHLGRPSSGAASPSRYHRFMQLTTRQLQHHNLWHEDRTSSWHSLEARVPFLDHRVVELLASVPASLQPRLFWNKQIVRSALDRLAPQHAIRQPKLAFLDGQDASSLDVIHHDMLQSVATQFRDKYLSDDRGPFDRAKVSQLIDKALGRGPQRAAAMREALHCMAITIFARHLTAPFDPTSEAERPTLRLMDAGDWQRWEHDMHEPPKCTRIWHPHEAVAWADGVEMVAPLAPLSGVIRFYRHGALAGELTMGSTQGWVSSFLRNLGTQATADFRIQDWLDEFDLSLAQFKPLLDVLLHQGVVVAALPDADEPTEQSSLTFATHD
jgi:asparagine synthase (glutamine-hydrolysing)